MVKCIEIETETDFLDVVNETIYKVHPVQIPRMEQNMQGSIGMPEMELVLNFYQDDEFQNYTQLMFLDGTYNNKSSLHDNYVIMKAISNNIVGDIVTFLLAQFPIIKELSLGYQSFSLKFIVPIEKQNEKGISCYAITLTFEKRNSELKEIIGKYFKYIVENFYEQVSKTPKFQYEYQKFCDKTKQEIIDSLGDKEVQELIKLLPIYKIRNLLNQLSSEEFLKIYDAFQHQQPKTENSKCLVKKSNTSEN